MQQRWKWLRVPVVVAGLALLIAGGLGVTAAGAAGLRGKWPRWTSPKTTLVPIISAGTPGVRLGVAQVSGPSGLVSRVRAVMQLDAAYQGVRAKVLVPSDSLSNLRRVQGTAVTAVVQYKLLGFSAKKKAAAVAPQPRQPQRKQSCTKDQHDQGKHKGWTKHKKHNHSQCKGGR